MAVRCAQVSARNVGSVEVDCRSNVGIADGSPATSHEADFSSSRTLFEACYSALRTGGRLAA